MEKIKEDLVSIIMPSYNCGEFVEETVRSVQAQTYQNWEILFVDDCSTDDTIIKLSQMQSKDPRIRLIQNKVNSGPAVSRNKALREARGRWIAFLDSDDQWAPAKLEKQLRFMEENGCKFSYTCYEEMDEDGVLTGVRVGGPSRITKAGMFAFCWPGCLTVMYDAASLGLLQISDIRKNNDYAMWLKLCRKADCYLLPEVLAKYRQGRRGSVSTHSIWTMIGWHYKLWHGAEGKSVLSSVWYTALNLVFGMYKKIRYVKR